ncbi:AAA family ATPase [Ancylobacter sp. Lp-2]|uniref:ATP-binding protein n=1 Tax=Ancylobacter sp. Lp-2 TaxID=2881339 RepID=UPI001E3FDFED|nr:AAA family ATPase [Ancylobacter sp. Lp-2]MCB4768047.1 AAA family ATPase [Ancylobacter sp. Lp-2]
MTIAAGRITPDRNALDGEWARVELLVMLAESLRSGATLPDAFPARFDDAGERVAGERANGSWAALRNVTAETVLHQFIQLDLDILALALAPEARPALAPRFHSLQPHTGEANPCLALIQELLMLDGGEQIGMLFDRLEPHSPLVASGIVRVVGKGAYQSVSASPVAAKALLGRATDLSPPPGAHLVTVEASWDDLVLPPAALADLRGFSTWIRCRDGVIDDWKARPLGGPLALFCGPSGSGKSFAAAVIATELTARTGENWALYALDLGRIMSKYVGETEQNLNALLDALDGRRAILQIDEADGLLGKRGEVTDARDRYANLEVSHMLSRFERHAGPVILTTNLRANIDAAFLRRFQQIVDFPAPDTKARRLLWERLLPARAPRAADLDIEELASGVRLSGGAIHNAAFFASVLAFEDGGTIAGEHLARAVWAELSKDNRQVRRSELGPLGRYLEETS